GQQDEDLNQEQKLAVDHALLADDFFCLHGPPGTGKTRTLVEIVRRAAKSGRDVLVCADSNQAIDNILVGSSTEGEVDDGSLHKYSQHGAEEFTVERRNTGRSSNRFVRKMYADSDVNRGDVVVSTNNSAADIHRQFDLAVIDEATQATCTSCLIPISKSDKFVLAGDHKQLPPYSAEEGPAQSEFGKSMFEHMYASGGVYESVGIQLKTQYRMHEEIVRFPNHGFYDGSLRNGRKVEETEEMDRPAVAYNLGGETEKIGTSYRNTTEAKMVERVVLRVIEEEGINSKNVGVITPYSAQVKEITRRLEGSGGEAATVDTIDSFQGSEREAVVISFVRS
ncbi:MAG: AAA domain-containing protein, partial [Halobacteria archaeon]|nr:AAA domain-containing protein [Halobacteria archaeon]